MRRIIAFVGVVGLVLIAFQGCGKDEKKKPEPAPVPLVFENQDFKCNIKAEELTVKATAEVDTATWPESQNWQIISDEQWDETAVQQVLHVFAFGGFASAEQIKAWADMPPQQAIIEMISMDAVNAKLSPADKILPAINKPENGNLRCLSQYWRSLSVVPADARENFDFDANRWNRSPGAVWASAVSMRGLNPVRQKIGWWETMYHMAVNQGNVIQIPNGQMAKYYDDIMNAHAALLPYEDIIGIAAVSATVATQYEHRRNIFNVANNKFEGNEDFGREIHQLYFAILGDYDNEWPVDPDAPFDDLKGRWGSQYHEQVTIPDTARALTGITVDRDEIRDVWQEYPTYATDSHYQSSVSIYGQQVDGQDAKEKISNLVKLSIEHQESLDNLPIKIIRGLADDNIDLESEDPGMQQKIVMIRAIWQEMPSKNFLEFIRKYAISTAFHNPLRYKYWTSVERNVMILNMFITDNYDAFVNHYYTLRHVLSKEDIALFEPAHDVFGGQTGLESIETASIFASGHNRAVEDIWQYHYIEETSVFEKDYRKIIPRSADGSYRIKDVASWLWNRMVADGWENYGVLEKAHLYALLAEGSDLALFIGKDIEKAYSEEEINSQSDIQTLILDVDRIGKLQLDSLDPDLRSQANVSVAKAIAFIGATPYMYAQQGRLVDNSAVSQEASEKDVVENAVE